MIGMTLLKQFYLYLLFLFRGSKILIISLCSLFALIIWANFAKLDNVSRAPGQIIPSGKTQVIQSNEGGVIDRIYVREGDIVKKDQIVLDISVDKISAAVIEARSKVAALRVVMQRLDAELYEKPLIFNDEFSDYPELTNNQQSLYNKRVKAFNDDIGSLNKMKSLLITELNLNKPLLQNGDISRVEVLRLERSIADIEAQISNKQNKYLQELQSELAKTEEDLISAEQILTQREVSLRDATVRSPSNGIVKNIRLTTIGGVLRPGDEIMQIVPTGDELILESKVLPSDIAYVKVGQMASVKFDAYDASIFGAATGVVSYVSPDTIIEAKPGGEITYYRVHIKVDTRQMRAGDKQKIVIQPGMVASAEITTGSQTVINYLLKPISKTFDNSLGER